MKSKPTSDEIVEFIKLQITAKYFDPVDSLASAMILSNELIDRRASLREAIQKLERLCLIETKPRKGSYISSIPSLNAFRNFIPSLIISNS